MKNKSFAVIGLGQFGMTLAVTLAESDCDVLAIDDKEENIEEISEKVTYAVKADVREPGILKALGVQNVDVAIIAVAENLEASISAKDLFFILFSCLTDHDIFFPEMSRASRPVTHTHHNCSSQCQWSDTSQIHGKDHDPLACHIQLRCQSSGKSYCSPRRSDLI